MKKGDFIQAFGRRKESTAQVRVYPLTKRETLTMGELKMQRGDIYVNLHKIEKYFPGEVNKLQYFSPLKTINSQNEYAITVTVRGGGQKGQLEATIHGLARALEKINKEVNHPLLKRKGFLTRDSRVKERRKAGFAQKARARKQSPKR